MVIKLQLIKLNPPREVAVMIKVFFSSARGELNPTSSEKYPTPLQIESCFLLITNHEFHESAATYPSPVKMRRQYIYISSNIYRISTLNHFFNPKLLIITSCICHNFCKISMDSCQHLPVLKNCTEYIPTFTNQKIS